MTARSRLRRTRHWTAVHVRRHVPFTMYTLASLAYGGWVAWNLIDLHH